MNDTALGGSLCWQWSCYEELSKDDLYEILAARQRVFYLEQHADDLDADGLDRTAWHLMGWKMCEGGLKELLAYLRVVFPGSKYKEASIGRVLTVPEARGKSLGRTAMREALDRLGPELSGESIRISAQSYLIDFYRSFGFKTVSDPYMEAGIEHVQMILEVLGH